MKIQWSEGGEMRMGSPAHYASVIIEGLDWTPEILKSSAFAFEAGVVQNTRLVLAHWDDEGSPSFRLLWFDTREKKIYRSAVIHDIPKSLEIEGQFKVRVHFYRHIVPEQSAVVDSFSPAPSELYTGLDEAGRIPVKIDFVNQTSLENGSPFGRAQVLLRGLEWHPEPLNSLGLVDKGDVKGKWIAVAEYQDFNEPKVQVYLLDRDQKKVYVSAVFAGGIEEMKIAGDFNVQVKRVIPQGEMLTLAEWKPLL